MEEPVDVFNISHMIDRFDALSKDRVFVDPEANKEYAQLSSWLKELKQRRLKDCECELISIKNEKIDSGFMCIHCGRIFGEYQEEKIKAIGIAQN
jgi:hypothetical protein